MTELSNPLVAQLPDGFCSQERKDFIRHNVSIFLLGDPMQSDVEYELESQQFYCDLGFDVYLFYRNGRIACLHTVTEVHHLYDMHSDSAFESDIHSTGQTVLVDKVKAIVITQATLLANQF